MSKILNFKLYLSVLVLAAPLSLKHLTMKCTHFQQKEQAAGDTYQTQWVRHAKTSRDRFLQIQLVHVSPPQEPNKII